jgi:hypothetical protein
MSTVEDIPEVEVVGQELAVQPQQSSSLIFKTDDPMEIMQRTSEVASALKEFVKAQGLTVNIKGREYVEVAGWQMLGMMLGVTPVVQHTTPVAEGWEARAELHDRSGRVVGAGEAECLTSEKDWKSRDDYARRSMAQTRAIGKAYRNTFGFIAQAAGYEVLPAEEAEGQPTEAAELVEHATGKEAEQVDKENQALLDELMSTHGMVKAKADALYDGYRTLEQKRALTVRLGKLIEQRQAAS